MAAKKKWNYQSTCPCCQRKANNRIREDLGVNVRECLSCAALFGEVEYEKRENVVKDGKHPDPNRVSCDHLMQFDVHILNEDGTEHSHRVGWMDVRTRQAVQG